MRNLHNIAPLPMILVFSISSDAIFLLVLESTHHLVSNPTKKHSGQGPWAFSQGLTSCRSSGEVATSVDKSPRDLKTLSISISNHSHPETKMLYTNCGTPCCIPSAYIQKKRGKCIVLFLAPSMRRLYNIRFPKHTMEMGSSLLLTLAQN